MKTTLKLRLCRSRKFIGSLPFLVKSSYSYSGVLSEGFIAVNLTCTKVYKILFVTFNSCNFYDWL